MSHVASTTAIMEQNFVKLGTKIGYSMNSVHKITAHLANDNVLKRFVPNCGMQDIPQGK